ncbi:MAG: Spy/CpxP family protein refolding chaperone [Terriglobales bacterium]
MKRKLWIALAVGAMVCGAAVAGVAAYEHGRGGMGMHMRFERLAVRLKLTSAQESQIKADLKQARTNARPEVQSMREMRATLAKQIFTDHPDQAAIQKNAEQLKQQLSTLIDDYVKAGMQINGVLSSGQRAEVQKIIAERQELARRRQARWHEHETHHGQMHGQPSGGQAPANQ